MIVHMVQSVQRLGLAPSATPDQRKLAVDLAEVLLKWELMASKGPSLLDTIPQVSAVSAASDRDRMLSDLKCNVGCFIIRI